jgi:hypothetical protein
VLAEVTMKALLSDPLMLQKEDVKWARQLQAWGRTLVVPPSSFMPGAREAAEKALQLRNASSTAGVAASVDGNSATAATTAAALSLHGASLSDALRLTPANVEVFTTRPASELSSTELASPLLLVPRAAPLVSSGGLSYLYPTARETGSIAQTRELGAALDNLQDAIATGFADPKLTRGRSAAREAEKRSEAAMHLAEELALQRLHNRRIMPEELIGRLSYAPRADGGAMMVSTAQAQRRHALLASSGALGRGISLSGPVTQHRSNHGSGSDFAQAARARRKANLDAGQALGKTPRQRHRARQEMERKLREEEEEQRRQEQSDSPGTRHSRAASPDKVGTASPTAAALLQPPSLSARDALTIPLPVDEIGMPPPLDSALYESVRLAEQEAVVLRYTTDVLNRSDGMWLRTLLQPPTTLVPASPQPPSAAEVVSVSAMPPSATRAIVGTAQPKSPRGTAAAVRGHHHRQRSSSSVSPQRRAIHSETPSETYTPVEAAVPSTAPAASPTFAAFHAARPLPGAPALAGPPPIAASSLSRTGAGGIGGAAGPALNGEQRVLHSGALELSRDVELEYGREWRFFEDRLPSQRAEVLQRAMQAAAAAAADDAEDDGTQQARNIQQSLQQSRTEQAGSPVGASEGSKHARKATEFIEHALWCQAAETEEAADDSEREQHPSTAAAASSTPASLLRPSISRSSPRSSEPRTLVALTPLGDEGVTVLLGSQAPRLYHWAAMLDTAAGAKGREEQQSSVSNADIIALSSSSAMPVLSVDALTRSLRAEVPQPPPASLSALSLPEPTLSQLTHEIATYRRDLRLLRKNMHSGQGVRPSSSPHGSGSGCGGGILSIIRPFTPCATNNGSAVVAEVASFARPEVLAQRAAKEAALARRRERDLRGSSAPAIQKMLRLRRYQEGPLVALAARAGRRGQQPNHHRPGSIMLEEDELLAAATADGGGGALLSSMGVQTSRTAKEEQAQAAKRFWRQNYKPRAASSSIHRNTAMTPRKLEGMEEKTANSLPLIDSYIKGPSMAVAANTACPDGSNSLPCFEGTAAATLGSLSSSLIPATPGAFSPPRSASRGSGSGFRVGTVYTPRLSDVLHKLTQPVPVQLLSDSQQALSARTAVGKKHAQAVDLRA